MQWHIAEQPTLDQAMKHTLEAVKPGISQSAYKTISTINFQATLDQSRKWIQHVLQSEPPPASICAIYFGLFDTSGRFSRKYEWQQMYISGADHFDPDDEGEWACGCLWEPKHRYPRMPLMKLIGKLCPFKENQAGFALSSALVAALAIDHAGILSKKLGFQSVSQYPIATGHDAGDIDILGYLTPNGFQSP